MEFDLLLLGKYPPEELLEIALIAEECGFGYLWYADEKFFRDPYLSLCYLGCNTDRIKVGICVTDPYTRHPAITAMAATSLAELIPGRFNLGIGAGYSGLYPLGIKQTKPLATMRESVQLMRELWTGEVVDFQGEQVSFRQGRLEFTPPEGTIPITIAATGRKMLQLAGEIADGIMVGDYASPFTLEAALKHIRAGAQCSGRSLTDRHVSARVNVVLDQDSQVAIDVVKKSIALSLWITYPKWDYYLDYTQDWEEQFAPLKDFVAEFGSKPRNVGDYALIEPYIDLVNNVMVFNRHLAGTIEDVTQQISSLAPIGVDRIAIYPVPLEGQTIVSILEEFAQSVMPGLN